MKIYNPVYKFILNVRNHIRKISHTIDMFLTPGQKINVVYWKGKNGRNFGDALNPILIKKLSGKKVVHPNEIINIGFDFTYSAIGSIIGFYSYKNLVIWGSGFSASNSKLDVFPERVCAVRGPLTRKSLLEKGVACPEVYGDPALLYPLFYTPTIEKRHSLGIIPHHEEQNNELLHVFLKKYPDILVIDILSDINKIIDDICSCEKIASSSLHGIIAADAYSIPSIYVKFTDVVPGGNFKYHDYFQSVGRTNEKPYQFSKNSSLESIYNHYHDYQIRLDLVKLLESCPFLTEKRTEQLKREIRDSPTLMKIQID